MNNEYDEYEPRERRERPAPSSNRTLWIVLLTAGCGMGLLCVAALGGLVYWGVKSFTNDIQPAQATVDQFLDRLKEGKIDGAYELTSSKFRKDQSPAEFAAYVKRFETFTRHTSRTGNGMQFFHDQSGKHMSVQTTLNAPNNALTCTVVVVEEGGAWKVDKVTVP